MSANNDETMILNQDQPIRPAGDQVIINGPANEQKPAGTTVDPQNERTPDAGKQTKIAAAGGVVLGAALGSAGTAFATGSEPDAAVEPGPGDVPADDPNAPVDNANNGMPQNQPANQADQPTAQTPGGETPGDVIPGGETPGGETPAAATELSIDGQQVDVTGDGQPDGVAIDADHDGVLEGIVLDTNQDGIADALIVDKDEDGVTDAIMVDTNEDGTFEQVLVDVNHDGGMDVVGVDMNADGAFTEDEFQPLAQDGDTINEGANQPEPLPDEEGNVAQEDYENNGDVDEWA